MSDKITIEEVRGWLADHNLPWRNAFTRSVAVLAVSQHEELIRLSAQLAERDAMLSEFHLLGYELDGVIHDTEKGAGFDSVCLATVKRVREAMSSAPATAKANAKIIAAAEEQERAQSQMGDYPDVVSREYVNACGATIEAVREKKELKP